MALALLSLAHAQEAAERRNLVPGQSGKRIALVIGNDAYQNVSKLEKAGNDATAMARELKAAGFEVLLHRDLNYRAMVKAVETLANSITGGDQVVVFFAGHGVQIKTGSYLLPIDIEAGSESEVEKTAYGLNDLTEKLSDAKAAFALVMVDACRDNPLRSKGRSIGNNRGLSAIEPPKGQMVVYSASRGQQALDRLSDGDRNPNGVFTREFISRMKRPGVRIEELVREVQDAVEESARSISHDQRPALYNEARGNFYFYRPAAVAAPVGAATTAALRARTPEEIEDSTWDRIKDDREALGFEEYLRQYAKGRYAGQARIALGKLKAEARRPAGATIALRAAPGSGDDPDTALWKAVEQGGSADDYEVYLKQYPKGKFAALVPARSEKLKRAAAEREIADAARLQQEQQQAALRDEAELWRIADAAADSVSVQNYLDRYPAGRHVDLARVRLEEVRKAEAEMRRRGKLVVFRESALLFGAAVTVAVSVDGAPAGILTTGSYVEIDLPPGARQIVARRLSSNGADMGQCRQGVNIVADQQHFFLVNIIWGTGCEFIAVQESNGPQEIGSLVKSN